MENVTRARFDALEYRSASAELRLQALEAQHRELMQFLEAEQSARIELEGRIADLEARAAAQKLGDLYVADLGGPAREHPAGDAPVLANLVPGALVQGTGMAFQGDGSTWIAVNLPGHRTHAWMHSSLLQRVWS